MKGRFGYLMIVDFPFCNSPLIIFLVSRLVLAFSIVYDYCKSKVISACIGRNNKQTLSSQLCILMTIMYLRYALQKNPVLKTLLALGKTKNKTPGALLHMLVNIPVKFYDSNNFRDMLNTRFCDVKTRENPNPQLF